MRLVGPHEQSGRFPSHARPVASRSGRSCMRLSATFIWRSVPHAAFVDSLAAGETGALRRAPRWAASAWPAVEVDRSARHGPKDAAPPAATMSWPPSAATGTCVSRPWAPRRSGKATTSGRSADSSAPRPRGGAGGATGAAMRSVGVTVTAPDATVTAAPAPFVERTIRRERPQRRVGRRSTYCAAKRQVFGGSLPALRAAQSGPPASAEGRDPCSKGRAFRRAAPAGRL